MIETYLKFHKNTTGCFRGIHILFKTYFFKYIYLGAFLLFSFSLSAQNYDSESDNEVSIYLSRTDSIPDEIESTSDSYFEGYVQALVDMHYHELRVVVIVKDHEIWLANLPKNALIKNSIISFVSDIPGVKEVHALNGVPPKDEKIREKYVERPISRGIWFPQTTVLFLPQVANPRQVTYSIGYRQGDKIMGKKAIQISLGDDFPIYRWLDVFWGWGDLQISVESGIWAVFNLYPEPNIGDGTELVNTDYYFGIPLTATFNEWAFRLRLYHISSHLGDEFLVNHPGFIRKNPSFEATDFFASYQLLQSLRLYLGVGAIFDSDPTFRLKPFYLDYGAEFRFLGVKFRKQRLFGAFFLAAHFRTYQYLKYDFDGTFVGGYEWSKLQGIGRKFRLFVEYHNGFSLEGQFMKMRTNYISYLLSYGF